MTRTGTGASGRRLGYSNHPTDPGDDPFAAARIDQAFIEAPAAAPGPGPAMTALKTYARPGDTVVAPAIEDFAWNLPQLRRLVRDFTTLSVDLEFLRENIAFGTRTTAAAEHLAALNAIADFEHHRTKQRQRAGIEAAKARGVYKGRQRILTDQQVAEICQRALEGVPKTHIARDLGISRETVYQYLRLASSRTAN